MGERKRFAAKAFGVTVLGVCGFVAAGVIATAGLAGPPTTTDTGGTTTTTTPEGDCHETVNPAGNPAVGDNGHPDDPYGGDAVPGGTSTKPGTNGNGPSNSDGFYLVGGLLFSDTTAIPYFLAPGDQQGAIVWPANTTIKYTEWGNPNIKITDQIGGPNSEIQYHVQAPGDLFVNAPMGAAGAIFCGVPPPPFKP